MKKIRATTVLAALIAPLVSVFACGDDDTQIACCRIQMYCDNCDCSTELAEIGVSGDEALCELAVEDRSLGCGSATFREGYSSEEGIRDCGGL